MHTSYLEWLQHPLLDTETRDELKSLIDKQEIEDRFYCHLSFGTAGIRGMLGAGTNRMNKYTIRRTTTGFAQYLQKMDPNVKTKGIAIAYDSRHQSPFFAHTAAEVLAYHGIRVFLFSELQPTPLLSYAVRQLNAAGGIVITASHNPPEYNGFKVYGPDGAQLLPASAQAILSEINLIEDMISLPVLPFTEGLEQGLIQFISPTIEEQYMKQLENLSLRKDRIYAMRNTFKIVFTPLHGTGNKPVQKILSRIGFQHVYVVEEQAHPDPDFPTVKTPNPEDPAAFAHALQLAQKQKADIVISTDPDADRLGALIRHQNQYIPLTGNQIGVLLLYYILEQKQQQKTLSQNATILKSIVTTDFTEKIASHYGAKTVNLLTGFKYIAERIAHFEKSDAETFLMGFEESYGYLLGDFVRDKDAVQAAMLICEMAAYYQYQSQTLIDVLEHLYQQFGYYQETLISYTFKGKEGLERINQIMIQLREHPPKQIAAMKVTQIEDYQAGLHDLPTANVLKAYLEDGSWIAIRPSGTEPKIKFYIATVAPTMKTSRDKITSMRQFIQDRIGAEK
ncbi:phospho-sugar mutase [Hazenella sp. IB182353]|uniref:phospho-sugar mutase n=1 Tax=Polycladospora coralii TaxID=2771432 RepID=UPI001746C433|nr:phospho-sugar mutase [Polycladospora coralii]MBS7530334.1 phospho-sugar mutase [Polycladospora coralii]